MRLRPRPLPYVVSFLVGAALAGAAAAASGCASSATPPRAPASSASVGEGAAQGAPAKGTGDGSATTDEAGKSAEVAPSFAAASNAFAVDMYRELRATKGNLVVSPASVAMAMAMPWAGARGQTSDEIKKVFHFGGTAEEIAASAGKLSAELQDPKRPVVFRIANQLFGEKTAPFEAPFLKLTSDAYGAQMERVDFKGAFDAERVRINEWVLGKTEKKIADLIPSGGLDAFTRLVLVNAIYFRGDWAEPFPKDATKKETFHAPSGAKQVNMMHAPRDRHYGYAESEGAKAVSIGYRGGEMSMVVIVPDARDGLPALEASLTRQKLDGVLGAISDRPVHLALPRFKVAPAAPLALAPVLATLGMPTAFLPSADFTGISNPPSSADRLHIERVFHKAFIEVDEQGTEAAAATGIAMATAPSIPPPPVELVVDRPFLFVLRDNASGLVLFMGRVEDPS